MRNVIDSKVKSSLLDVFRVLQHHAEQRTYTCRAGSDDEDRIFFLDFGYSCRPEAGCKYVPDKKRLLVRDTVRNLVESLVGIGDADEFCLTSVDAAAKSPAAVRRLAVVDIAVLAEPAFTAVGLDIDRHPVPGRYRMDLFPYLGDYSYHLVADGDSGNGTGHASVLDVQVAGADARQSDLHYGILRVENPRLRFLQKGKMTLVYVCVCFHRFL